MTDTHTHIYLDDFKGEEQAAVDRAASVGVTRLIFPNVDVASIEPLLRLHRANPASTRIAMGIHPTELCEGWSADVDRIESIIEEGGCSAVGEVGIDLYWDKTYVDRQKEAFSRQLYIAIRHRLPVIIHCRDGFDEALEVIASKDRNSLPPLVFHSFTSGIATVRKVREVCDAWFGINGVVTFKNARELREALPEIGIGRILLETDSPWLAPVPCRGRRNESANIKYIRDCVASVLGVSPEETEEITDRNAAKIFGF